MRRLLQRVSGGARGILVELAVVVCFVAFCLLVSVLVLWFVGA